MTKHFFLRVGQNNFGNKIPFFCLFWQVWFVVAIADIIINSVLENEITWWEPSSGCHHQHLIFHYCPVQLQVKSLIFNRKIENYVYLFLSSSGRSSGCSSRQSYFKHWNLFWMNETIVQLQVKSLIFSRHNVNYVYLFLRMFLGTFLRTGNKAETITGIPRFPRFRFPQFLI